MACTLDQHTFSTTGTGTNQFQITVSATAGSRVFVLAAANTQTVTSVVSPTFPGGWTPRGAVTSGNNCFVYYIDAPSGLSTEIVSINWSGTANGGSRAWSVLGFDPTNPFDGTTVTSGTAATNYTPSHAHCFVWSVGATNNPNSTAGTGGIGWTMLDVGANTDFVFAQYQIITTIPGSPINGDVFTGINADRNIMDALTSDATTVAAILMGAICL